MERFQNRHHDSISPLDWGLCSQVEVRCVPVVVATKVIRSLRNSGASSEWMRSGEPRRKWSLSVHEGDEKDGFCETVDQGQGFGFAGDGEALALEVHSVAGTRFGRGVGGE